MEEYVEGMRVKIRERPFLKAQFYGVFGTVEAVRNVYPANDKPYVMLHVKLEVPVETAGVDGHIRHESVSLPGECFEAVA